MDRKEIAKFAASMKTKADLLLLLNRIKGEDLSIANAKMHKTPFNIRQLNYYCNPNHISKRYREFKIPKKDGNFRSISSPHTVTYKLMLQAVNILLKSLYTPSNYAMGFAERRSVVTNASVHCQQNYVYNIDLKDFFPSIAQARVWKRLQLPPFNFPKEVANVIAGLCSIKEIKIINEEAVVSYHLPQGAPTSPIITNMICDNLDRRLAGLAKRFNLHYTRYADDITFSSMHNVYHDKDIFFKELQRIIVGQNFTINEKKTRLQKKGSRQEVTGLTVCEKPNVTKSYTRNLRDILYIWQKYGISSAQTKIHLNYKRGKSQSPNIINVISGKLQYLKMVKGGKDSVYTRLHNQFLLLCDKATSSSQKRMSGVIYQETMSLVDFEKKNSTEIIFRKDYKCMARCATMDLAGQETIIYIVKNMQEEDLQRKYKLAISNCCGKQGGQFWLIHYINKKTRPIAPVNLDELNNELDSFIKT